MAKKLRYTPPHSGPAFTHVPTPESDRQIVEGKLTDSEWVREFIHRRRRQIAVHSVVYYRFDNNVIPDHTWQEWAEQLAIVQKRHKEISATLGWHDEDFAEWAGTTGMHLLFPELYSTAQRLIR